MTWDETGNLIKAAFLASARQYDPTWHELLCRWEHEPRAAGELQIELSPVSMTDDHARPRKVNTFVLGEISTELEIVKVMGVQCKVTAASQQKFSLALEAAENIRTGMFTRAVQSLLTADDDESETATRAVMLAPLGPLMVVHGQQDNRKTLNWIFDAKFRVKITKADPDLGGAIEHVQGTGTITHDDPGDPIETEYEVPVP